MDRFEENLNPDQNQETKTLEVEDEIIKADEFFQSKGLSEKERELALLALRNYLESGDPHVGQEHIKDVSRESLKRIGVALREWIENRPIEDKDLENENLEK